MSRDPLVELDPLGYAVFFAIVAIIIALVFWWLQSREKGMREKYLSQFDPSDLRMSPYKVGLVYRVVSATEDGVSVIPVWNRSGIVVQGAQLVVPEEALIPFDRTRFQ